MTTTAVDRPRRGRGQPTKLTPQVQQRIVTALAAGNYLTVAVNYAGIDYSTFRNWMNRGERAVEERSRRRGDAPYVDFFTAVSSVETEAEVGAVAQLRGHFPTHPAAGQWWLERRHRERWAPARQVDADGNADRDNAALILVKGEQVNVFDRAAVLAEQRQLAARFAQEEERVGEK